MIFLHGIRNLPHDSLLAKTNKSVRICFDDIASFQSFSNQFCIWENTPIGTSIHPTSFHHIFKKVFCKTRHNSSPTDHKRLYTRKKSTFQRPVMRQLWCNCWEKNPKNKNQTTQFSPQFFAAIDSMKLRSYLIEPAGLIFKSNSV